MIIGMVRYAIPNAFTDRNNSRNLIQLYEEPYFSNRFNIFSKITLESFNQQTNKDFKLLVYHTNLIPLDKKKLFDTIEKKYSFVRNIYILDSNMYVPDDLKDNKILTFRIDNDDGIAIDFIEKLVNIKNTHDEDLAITIPHIYKLCKIDDNKYKTMSIDYVSNSIGIAYLTKEDKNIFDLGNHSSIAKMYKTVKLEGNGGLQIINGYNVINEFEREIDKNKSEKLTLNYRDMQQFLIKNNYAKMDITCLPIIK